jgi:serine protease Do
MLIGDKKPNESAVVTIERNRKVQTLALRLGNRESALAKLSQNIKGMDIATITPKIRQGLRLTVSNGIVVLKVEPNSSMYGSGFRVGDVIIQVENDTMSSLENVKKALLRNGIKRVFVNRYGKIGIITVQ